MSLMKTAPQSAPEVSPGSETDCWGGNPDIATNREGLDYGALNAIARESGLFNGEDIFSSEIDTPYDLAQAPTSPSAEPLWGDRQLESNNIPLKTSPPTILSQLSELSTTIDPKSISSPDYDRLIKSSLLTNTGGILESYPPKHIHSFQLNGTDYQIGVQFDRQSGQHSLSGDEATLRAFAQLRKESPTQKTEPAPEALW
jgi:hypothetical protein